MSKSSRKKKRNSAADIGKQEARSSIGQQMLDRPKESICQDGGRTRFSSRYYDWVFLYLTLLFVVIVRTRLLDFPLERDEGEYAYLGQLIQQGIPPYSIAYNMKLPGTYFMYAVIMSLFGQTIMAVHLGLMLINCVTILLVYKISAKIVNSFAGTIAACTYALLSLSPSVFGFAAHATHFVAFWAMAGLLVLLYALEKNTSYLYFASGALLALAFVMKQPGIFFVFWGAAHIVLDSCQNKSFRLKRVFSSLSMFLCGVLVVVFIMIVYLYASGVFDKFWFFTFVYLFKYGSKIPLSMAADSFMAMFPRIVDGFFLIWVFAGLGLVSLFLHSRLQSKRIPVSLFAVCSFLTVCPGFFYFRRHYFILLLPVVSLLTGIFIDSVYARSRSAFATRVSVFKQALPRCIAVAFFALAVMIGVVNQSEYPFEKDPVSLCRSIYGDH
jgi:4-amino-4-deoxy-L-arabinose transferase-like glycosyltransferase